MASPAPLLSFLRPLQLPRPSTIRHFLRPSTLSRCHSRTLASEANTSRSSAQRSFTPLTTENRQTEDPNLVASLSASPSYPPPSMKSLPRPKVSKASRRVSHPPKIRPYPTRQPSHHQPSLAKLIPEPVTPLPSDQCAPNLAYFVTRTRNNELPVYHDRKRGGNLKLTLVRKIDGAPEVLRDALREKLSLAREDCVVNPVTRQVVMKGHWKGEVDRFLRERMF